MGGCIILYISIFLLLFMEAAKAEMGGKADKEGEGPSHNQSESDDDGEGSSSSAKPEADEVGGERSR